MIKQQLEDTFEKLVEQGATQAKKAAKSTVQQASSAISASKMWEQILGIKTDSGTDTATSADEKRSGKTTEVGKGKNHSPLNLEKLANSYQNNEKQKTEILRQRLFQLVRRGEEEILYEKKKEEQEKKQKEAQEIEMKKRKVEENKNNQAGELPQGKVRKSIFSHKKVAQRQHAEIKPSSGKQ